MNENKDDFKRTQKLAIYKEVEHGYKSVCESVFDNYAGYVRLTEFVEVTFPKLQDGTIIQKHLDALDRAEAAITEKYFAKLADIKQQKEELRAITYQPEPQS